MGDTSGDATRATAAERRNQVIALRRRRATFDQIGRALGITRQNAWKIYQEALDAIPAANLAEHRIEELILVDDAISDLMRIARDHDRPRTAVEAWNSIRGWSEHKARLLRLTNQQRIEVDDIMVRQVVAVVAAEADEAERVATGLPRLAG